MNDFLNDLYNYISEDMLPLRKDPEYERAVQAYIWKLRQKSRKK